MTVGWRGRLAGIGGIVLLQLAYCPPAGAATLSCADAARIAEAESALPPGLLLAIGQIESGRIDGTGQRSPWPWTINASGLGRFFGTANDAVRAVRELHAAGVRSIDIGCFQISLLYHEKAFTDLVSGFDPLINARAAARFLLSLRDELGDWKPAIAAYHSRTNALGGPYRERVLAAWNGVPWHSVPGSRMVTLASVRVWGPSGPDDLEIRTSSWQHVFMPAGGSRYRLPRVITGSPR